MSQTHPLFQHVEATKQLDSTQFDDPEYWFSQEDQVIPYCNLVYLRRPRFPSLKNHVSFNHKNDIYTFGGYDGNMNTYWLFKLNTSRNVWHFQPAQGIIPQPRNGHACVVVNDTMYLIGGWLGNSEFQSAAETVYTLNLVTYEWAILYTTGDVLGASNMHTAEYYEGRIYVFRGGDGQFYLNDLHSLDVTTRVWRREQLRGTPPTPRANHASAIVQNCMYIYGGWNGSDRYNDLYCIDLTTMTSTQINADLCMPAVPPTRAGGKMIGYHDSIFLTISGSSNHHNNNSNRSPSILEDFQLELWKFSIPHAQWTMISVYNTSTQVLKVHPEGIQMLTHSVTTGKPTVEDGNLCQAVSLDFRCGFSIALHETHLYITGGSQSNSSNLLTNFIIIDIDPRPVMILTDPIEKTHYPHMFFLRESSMYFDNPKYSDIIFVVEDAQQQNQNEQERYASNVNNHNISYNHQDEFQQNENQHNNGRRESAMQAIGPQMVTAHAKDPSLIEAIGSERQQYETQPSQIKYPSNRRQRLPAEQDQSQQQQQQQQQQQLEQQHQKQEQNYRQEVTGNSTNEYQKQQQNEANQMTNNNSSSNQNQNAKDTHNQYNAGVTTSKVRNNPSSEMISQDSTKISLNASSIIPNGDLSEQEEYRHIEQQLRRLLELPEVQRCIDEEKLLTSYITRNEPQVCLLSQEWAKEYTQSLLQRQVLRKPIDNSHLLDSSQKTILSQYVQDQDYILVNEKVWFIISFLYGGSQQFKVVKNVSIHIFRPARLENNSNYCYMNACIQSICSIPELSKYFIEKQHDEVKKHKKNKGMPFSLAYQQLFDYLKKTRQPDRIVKLNVFMQLSIDKFDPREQHDAQEYLLYLLGEIQDELNFLKPAKKPAEFKDSESALSFYLEYHTSIIDKLFAGQLISNVKCGKCKHNSATYDPFLDLSLPIDSKSIKTINQALDLFIKPQEIDGDYKCDKCKKTSKAVQSSVIGKAPQNLVIHLKRFKMFPYREKITSDIAYSHQLDMSKYLADPKKEQAMYQLTNVIVHSGRVEYGHYVAFTKRNGEWWYCDDENVQQCDAKEVLDRQAYLLFYQKVQ